MTMICNASVDFEGKNLDAVCLYYDIRYNLAEFVCWTVRMLYETKIRVGEFAY